MNSDFSVFLIDGDCTLCNRTVVWVLKRRLADDIYFYPLQSIPAVDFLSMNGVCDLSKMDSSFYVTKNGIFKKSMVFFMISKKLRYPFSLLYYLRYIPRPLTDLVYEFISKTRYVFFGKQNTLCELLLPKYASFMLDDDEAELFFKTKVI